MFLEAQVIVFFGLLIITVDAHSKSKIVRETAQFMSLKFALFRNCLFVPPCKL